MKLTHLFYLSIGILLIACKPNTPTSPTAIDEWKENLYKGQQFVRIYQNDSAVLVLNELITDEVKTAAPKIYLQAEVSLGTMYSDMGMNVEALAHYQNALSLAEELGEREAIPAIYKNIGVLHAQWKKFDEALSYYDKAKTLAKVQGDEDLLADCENNQGTVLEQQNKFEEALVAYNKALEHYSKKKMLPKIAMAYSNMAIVYKLQKNYQQSVDFNLKAIGILDTLQDKWSLAATYNNIGNLYGLLGETQKGIDFCTKSLNLAKEINAEEIIGIAYESLSEIAAQEKDYKMAYDYHIGYAKSINQFINKENTQQLEELKIKYDTEKKEKQFAEARLKTKQKDFWLILLVVGILFGLILFRNFQLRVRHSQKQMALENELLKEQAHSKIQEQRLEIARDLHDSLGSQLTFIHLMLESLKDPTNRGEDEMESKLASLSSISQQSITELRNTLWVLNAKEILLGDLKSKLQNFLKHAADSKETMKFHVNFTAAEYTKLNSRQAVNLFRVVQEIISNAIKYSDASNLSINVSQNDYTLLMHIADDGKGFNYEEAKKKSYGLQNIQTRIKSINGKVEIKTAEGSGTAYQIQLELI